jgi:hypothetical protein
MLPRFLFVAATLTVSSVLASPIIEGGGNSGEAAAAREYFYVGGNYVNTSLGHIFSGQMYVEKLIPIKPCQPYPLVFIHGQAQTGTVCFEFTFRRRKEVGEKNSKNELIGLLELVKQTRRRTRVGDVFPE